MSLVSRIEPIFLRYKFPHSVSYEYSAGKIDYMDVALLRVWSDDGLHGLGEVTHGEYCYEPVAGIVEYFDRLLRGLPVGEIGRAWETMYQSSVFWNRQGVAIGVMGGIDIALHDLWGKKLGLPVHLLLGGAVRSRIRAYASNGLFREAAPLIEDVERARAGGFTAYKLRIVEPETIVSQVEAVRRHHGRSIDLIVDAVQGSCAVPWSIKLMQRLAHELAPYDVLWLEEPCRVEDIEGYVHLRQTASVNIAGAESIPTAAAFQPYLEKQAFDIVQFDIATSGFTEGRRIAHLAALHRKPIAVHSWGSAVSAMAGIHFSLATPNCSISEFCFMDHPINEHLGHSARPKNGYFHAPSAPGLGVTLSDDLRELYPYAPGPNGIISTDEKDLMLWYRRPSGEDVSATNISSDPKPKAIGVETMTRR